MAISGFLFMACVLTRLLLFLAPRDVIKLKFEFEVFFRLG